MKVSNTATTERKGASTAYQRNCFLVTVFLCSISSFGKVRMCGLNVSWCHEGVISSTHNIGTPSNNAKPRLYILYLCQVQVVGTIVHIISFKLRWKNGLETFLKRNCSKIIKEQSFLYQAAEEQNSLTANFKLSV